MFTEKELHILHARVLLDGPGKGKKKSHIPLSAFKQAIHFLISFANNGPQRAFDTYSPSIVNSFGFAALTSNALASVGLFLQIPVSFVVSYVSDRFNRRGDTVILGLSMHLLAYILNRAFTDLSSRGVLYFGVVWTQIFGTFPHPLNIAWMALSCRNSEERALAMAMVIKGANFAGIYGAQIFRADDRPKYRRGFSVSSSVLAVGVTLAISRFLDDKLRARRIAKLPPSEADTSVTDKPDGQIKEHVEETKRVEG